MLDGNIAGVHVLVGAVDSEQSPQLGDRRRVVLDAQLEDAVGPGPAGGLPLDDQHGRRLLAADVPAGGLRRLEGGHQPVGEIAIGGLVSL